MGLLNFDDIQGGILRGYNFAAGVHYFVHLEGPGEGRALLRDLLPEVTTAREWESPPAIALNVALTFSGLGLLGIDESLRESLPSAFREPIRRRAPRQLGDDLALWEDEYGRPDTHLVVLIASSETRGEHDSFGLRFPKLASAGAWLAERLRAHRASLVHREEVEALPENQREHFGFTDGFGQPAVEGVSNNWPGQGVPVRKTGEWRDVKAGEFILGYPNEDGDPIPGAASWLLTNGSYMVYRKLAQNVPLFHRIVFDEGRRYATAGFDAGRLEQPVSDQAALELMAAKLVGRWRDGKALELDPRRPGVGDLREEAYCHIDNDFRYGEDLVGWICPRGAHIRRANPRDLLGRDGDESRRHRIIRRGMPFGPPYKDWDKRPSGEDMPDDDYKRGLIFICFNADFERQFELVQGQWCNDGNDFGLGDDQDYLLGSRTGGKLAIEGEPPYLLNKDHRLVSTRGCEYLLMPGLMALERLSAPDSRVEHLEQIPPEEPDAIHRVTEMVCDEMRSGYKRSRPMLRGQHPKSHACLQAKVSIENVPDDLKHGLFAVKTDEPYDAWVRFSASHSALQSDAKADAQGMAIKIMGVGEEKILPQERWRRTQDFILVNHDTFFLHDVEEVAQFARAVTPTGSVRGKGVDMVRRTLKFFFPRDPRHWRPRTFGILQVMLSTKPTNPLDLEYWSETPYALGDNAVKYAVKPIASKGRARLPRPDWDAIEDAVEEALKPDDAEYLFELLVQRQADPISMPVEDPTVRWDQNDSPYRRVATIRIAHQAVTVQHRRNFGENLTFTPWHSRWDHRPLGGINRLRRAVYEASSRLRHEHNNAPISEPGGVIDGHPPRLKDALATAAPGQAAGAGTPPPG